MANAQIHQIWMSSALASIRPMSMQIGGCARLAPNKGQLRSVRRSVSSTRERGLLLPAASPAGSRDLAAGSG
jgi:hypothetical protein